MDRGLRVLLFATIFSISFMGVSVIYQDLLLFVIFMISVIVLVLIKTYMSRNMFDRNTDADNARKIMEAQKLVTNVETVDFKKDLFDKMIHIPIIGSILNFIETDIRERSGPAGIVVDEKKLMHKYGFILIVGIFTAPVLALLLYVITSNIFLLAVSAASVILLIGARIYLHTLASNRKTMVEKDLLFFLPFVEILNHSGRGMVDTFNFIIKSAMFEGMSREIALFRRRSNMGVPDLSSLEDTVRFHPSETFAEFIRKYVSFAHTDRSEVKSYLAESVKLTYRNFDEKISGYAGKMAGLFILFSTSSIIGPIMIITVILFPGVNIDSGLLLAVINLVPFMFMMVGVISTPPIQIKNQITIPIPIMIAALIIGIVVVYLIQQDILLALLVGVAAASTVGAIKSGPQRKDIAKMESEIPHVIRTMITKKEKGIDLIRILKEIPSDRGLSPVTAESFRILTKRLTAHTIISAQTYASSSGLMKIVNFVTHSISDSGGGDRRSLESFSDMVIKITHGQHLFIKSVNGSLMFLFATPAIILFGTTMITLISGGSFEIPTLDNTEIDVDVEGVINGLKYTVITYVLCIGVTISKGVYNNLKILWPVAVCTGSGAFVVGFWDILYDLIVNNLF